MRFGRSYARAQRRKDPGAMNATEKAYYEQLLLELRAGELREVFPFEAMTFTVADPPNAKKARITPDFAVVDKDGFLEVREVKGYMESDAQQKLKALAEKYPFRVKVVRRKAKKDGGGWSVEEY